MIYYGTQNSLSIYISIYKENGTSTNAANVKKERGVHIRSVVGNKRSR